MPYKLCFFGCTFYLTGFTEKTTPDNLEFTPKQLKNVETNISNFGGTWLTQYDPAKVTHVITDTQSNPIVVRAKGEGKRIVNLYWLEDCLTNGTLTLPEKALHFPRSPYISLDKPEKLDQMPNSSNLVSFRNEIISVSGFSFPEISVLRELVMQIGAKFTTSFSVHNTLLISMDTKKEKYNYANQWSIPVVSAHWLLDVFLGLNDAHKKPFGSYHFRHKQIDSKDPFEMDRAAMRPLMTGWKFPIRLDREVLSIKLSSLSTKKSKDDQKEETTAASTADLPKDKKETDAAAEGETEPPKATDDQTVESNGNEKTEETITTETPIVDSSVTNPETLPAGDSKSEEKPSETKSANETQNETPNSSDPIDVSLESPNNNLAHGTKHQLTPDDSLFTKPSPTGPVAKKPRTGSSIVDSALTPPANVMSPSKMPSLIPLLDTVAPINSSIPPSVLRTTVSNNTYESNYKVLVTGFTHSKRKELEEIIKKLNGKLTTNASEVTHLVIDEPRTTLNFLFSINYAQFVVHSDWLYASSRAGKFVPEINYTFDGVRKLLEKRNSLRRKDPKTGQLVGKLFSSFIFFITPSVNPSIAILRRLISATLSGQVITDTLPQKAQLDKLHSQNIKFVFIAAESDYYMLNAYKAWNIRKLK